MAEGADSLQKDGTVHLKETLLQAEKDAADKLLPYLEDELPSLLSIFEDTRDRAQSSAYDLRPEGMKGVTVYIIRTDLK